MRVAIIGCGPSGLISAKYCLTALNNLESLHIYDKLPCVGGIWCEQKNYSILYENLRTNLPKEVMEFEGLHYETNEDSSFVTPEVVTRYIKLFTEKYQIENYIKFETEVMKVSRLNGYWKLTAHHLPTGNITAEIYDAIFVCNGHYTTPEIPDFNGLEEFRNGKVEDAVIHSNRYRSPKIYQGLDVLLIGAGPSGQDLAIDLASSARKVYLSHHLERLYSVQFPDNVIHKQDIKCFNKDGVVFKDGTSCTIDRVILATGFRYNMDFLDDSCGIKLDSHTYVTPLFKQIICIKNPTLTFVGLPFKSFLFPLFEIQVKCIIQVLNGTVQLPTVDDMMKELNIMEERYQSLNIPKKRYHCIVHNYREYMTDLSKFARVEPIKDVIFNIFEMANGFRQNNLMYYRNNRFVILDSQHFKRIEVAPERKEVGERNVRNMK